MSSLNKERNQRKRDFYVFLYGTSRKLCGTKVGNRIAARDKRAAMTAPYGVMQPIYTFGNSGSPEATRFVESRVRSEHLRINHPHTLTGRW